MTDKECTTCEEETKTEAVVETETTETPTEVTETPATDTEPKAA